MMNLKQNLVIYFMWTPGSIVTTAREANGDLNNDKDKKCYEPGNDFTRATRVGGV